MLGNCDAPVSCTRFSVPPASVIAALLFNIEMLFSEIVPRSFVAVTAVAVPVVKLKLKSVVSSKVGNTSPTQFAAALKLPVSGFVAVPAPGPVKVTVAAEADHVRRATGRMRPKRMRVFMV